MRIARAYVPEHAQWATAEREWVLVHRVGRGRAHRQMLGSLWKPFGTTPDRRLALSTSMS